MPPWEMLINILRSAIRLKISHACGFVGELKFLVDHMLGKLAKYLRFMGYDVFYPTSTMDDSLLIKIARKEKRIILTRDKELAKLGDGVFIPSDRYEEQLKYVISKFKLNMDNILTRCSICNEILVKVDKNEVKGKVPDYVYENNDEFYQCPKCHRIYWFGTHTRRIKEKIERIMEDAEIES